jgi:hypothetical protein
MACYRDSFTFFFFYTPTEASGCSALDVWVAQKIVKSYSDAFSWMNNSISSPTTVRLCWDILNRNTVFTQSVVIQIVIIIIQQRVSSKKKAKNIFKQCFLFPFALRHTIFKFLRNSVSYCLQYMEANFEMQHAQICYDARSWKRVEFVLYPRNNGLNFNT